MGTLAKSRYSRLPTLSGGGGDAGDGDAPDGQERRPDVLLESGGSGEAYDAWELRPRVQRVGEGRGPGLDDILRT